MADSLPWGIIINIPQRHSNNSLLLLFNISSLRTKYIKKYIEIQDIQSGLLIYRILKGYFDQYQPLFQGRKLFYKQVHILERVGTKMLQQQGCI